MVLENILQSPLDCKVIKPVHPKGNQSWQFPELELHWKDWCWSWSSNPLVTYEELTHYKRPWCWERLREDEKRVTEDEMVDGITDLMDMSLSKLWERVEVREAWGAAVHGVSKGRTRLRDWTTAVVVWLDLGCLFSLCHVRFWFLSFTKPLCPVFLMFFKFSLFLFLLCFCLSFSSSNYMSNLIQAISR